MSQTATPQPIGNPSGGSPPALDRPVSRLKAERVELLLASLPGWEAAPGGEGIQRQFQFGHVGQALAVAGLICGLSERWQRRPAVRIEGSAVTFELAAHEAGKPATSVVRVARRIGLHGATA